MSYSNRSTIWRGGELIQKFERSSLPGELSFEFSRGSSQGAVLVLKGPLRREMIQHYRSDLLRQYIAKNIKSWYIFANRVHHRGIKIAHITFVTHAYRTSSWAAAVACGISSEVSLSFSAGALGVVSAGASLNRSFEHRGSVVCTSGPHYDCDVEAGEQASTREDQTVFVQGWMTENRLPFLKPLRISTAMSRSPNLRSRNDYDCETNHGSRSRQFNARDVSYP